MSISATVKDKDDDKTYCLSLKDQQLIIQELSSPTAEQQAETIDLDLIYGIDFDSTQLTIHLVTTENPVSVPDHDKKNLLTNVRPKDTKWTRRTLCYTHTAATSQSDFFQQLQYQALPHRTTLASTKIILIVNPTSGSQQAESHYANIVYPMLRQAGFLDANITKIQTQKDGKTRALAESLGQRILTNRDDPTIVVSMGGDGTLHEIVNGLADATAIAIGQFRLGVIPAGSGNAFALGLGLDNSIEQATLRIIRATTEKPFYWMDVQFGHSNAADKWQDHVHYDKTKQSTRLLVVMSWGFHAQIVSKSRYLRYFMGNKRFSLVAMVLLKFLQQYQGELVLRKAQKYDVDTQAFIHQEDDVVLDDKKFTYFIVSKQHSLEKGFKIAPFASALTQDMDIVLLREVDADALTQASIQAFQQGKHVDLANVEYFKATELMLRVKEKAELCLDGEIHQLPANGVVHLQVVGSNTELSSFTIFV
jgi:diacylglycerol kinase family enzyme